jgi:hypothetical protein
MVNQCGPHMIFLLLYLPAIISFGGVTNDHKEEAKNHGLSIFSWEEFLITVSIGLLWPML